MCDSNFLDVARKQRGDLLKVWSGVQMTGNDRGGMERVGRSFR